MLCIETTNSNEPIISKISKNSYQTEKNNNRQNQLMGVKIAETIEKIASVE